MTRLRFTDCDIWDNPWFMDLPMEHKLFWRYLCDRCDNAGVWIPNARLASLHIGFDINLGTALAALAPEIEVMPNGNWNITKFVAFQHPGGLSEKSAPHRQVLRLLSSHGLPLISTLEESGSRLPCSPKAQHSTARTNSERGSAEGGALTAEQEEIRIGCDFNGVDQSLKSINEWAEALRFRAGCKTVQEARACMDWAVKLQRTASKDVSYARHCNTPFAQWQAVKDQFYKPNRKKDSV